MKRKVFRLAMLAGAAVGLSIVPAENSAAQTGDSGKPICLGTTLAQCKSAIEARATIAHGDLDAVIGSWGKLDVSGRPVPGKTRAVIFVRQKGAKSPSANLPVVINLDRDGLVDSVSVDVRKDIGSASTMEEYESTGSFDAAKLLLPFSGCAESDKLHFYRFLNERLKPSIEGPEREGYASPESATDEYIYRSARLPLCGAYIDYRRDKGVSTFFMDSDNPAGKYDNMQLIFWRLPSTY